MTSGAYGETSGSDSRGSRPTMERLMVFGLADEIARLRSESQWTDTDRNSITLAKEVDFRVLLTVLREGASIEENDGDARVSVQVLEGRATLQLGADSIDGGEGADLEAAHLAAIDAGQPWRLRASTECAMLLTFAWPREKAGI
jgi:quercetin dioxygenase-like cupin family protein